MNDQERHSEEQEEFEPSPHESLIAVLWVLAALMAEIELTWWWFGRMYGS